MPADTPTPKAAITRTITRANGVINMMEERSTKKRMAGSCYEPCRWFAGYGESTAGSNSIFPQPPKHLFITPSALFKTIFKLTPSCRGTSLSLAAVIGHTISQLCLNGIRGCWVNPTQNEYRDNCTTSDYLKVSAAAIVLVSLVILAWARKVVKPGSDIYNTRSCTVRI